MNTASWRAPSSSPRAAGLAWASPRARREPKSAQIPAAPRPTSSIEIRLLSELVRAHEDFFTLIDSALQGPAARAPDLVALRGDLHRRLEQLRDSVRELCRNDEIAFAAWTPVVFFVDEQVERALVNSVDPGRYHWIPLQRTFTQDGKVEGGNAFFERIEALKEDASPIVVATYLFCLKANFRGRLADEPEDAADDLMEHLTARLPAPSGEGAACPVGWRKARPASTYVGAAAGAVLVWHVLVLLWACFR